MGNMIGTIVGGAMGTVGGIFSSIAGIKWDKKMSKLMEEDPAYTEDPYTKQRYGMAQTLLNARMPGAASRERNIYGAGANAVANYGRGATDANQFLSMAAATQGMEGQQFDQMQQQEGQDYYNKLGIYNDASKGMTEEHRNVFDDSVRRWQDKININTAQYKARAAGGQSFTNMGGAAQSGMNSAGYSDKRLKENIAFVGKSPSGVNIYHFSYLGDKKRYQGVMADELSDNTFVDKDGYLMVDYSKIDVTYKLLN